MSGHRKTNISVILAGKLAFAAVGFTAVSTQSANAAAFTAEKVMKEMDEKQRFSYLAGVVEGLAVARYMKDGKKPEGMNCIYGWFYNDKTAVDVIYAAFDKYASYPPGSVVDVLAKQKCGE